MVLVSRVQIPGMLFAFHLIVKPLPAKGKY